MNLADLTPERLEELAARVGAAAGQAYAETVLAAEDDLAAAEPPSPLQVTGQAILDLIPEWALEAANVPRVGLPKQAALLGLAKTYRQQLAEAKLNEEATEKP